MATKRAERGKRGLAPPVEVERLIAFLNSRARGSRPDGLASRQSGRALLRGLGLDPGPLDATGLERLRRLRDLLAVLAERAGGDGGRSVAWDAVNEIAEDVPTVVRFRSDVESEVCPAGQGIDATVGGLIADLHRAVSSDSWRRVRL